MSEHQDLIHDWNVHEPRPARAKAITIDDETLRDGLQSPSVHDPDIGDKVEILHLMNELGIHTADIGLPGAGPRAVADVTRLAEEIRDAKLTTKANCAARTVIADVQPIVDIVQKTGVPIMACTFMGSSEIRKYTESWDLERMLKHTTDAIDFAVKEGLEVMYVTEDTTRAQPETIKTLYKAAIDHGASRLCVCDTVGHVEPRGVMALGKFFHDDRGLGLINALAAIEAGFDQVHGTALGIGERCGNTATDQLLVNMRLMGYLDESIDLTALPRYVEKVSQACKVPTPKNYPVFGVDAFETATGVHAAAVIKALRKGDVALADAVYSGVPAGVFGLEQKITIGPMSGRSNVTFWLEKRNVKTSDELVDKIFNAAKQSKRIFTEDEVWAMVKEHQAVEV
jgi:2-isopropylmalate synthase